MGFVVEFFASLLQNGQGDEGHESHEEEGDLCQACPSPCLRRQDHQDQDRTHQVRPYQEQEWQDREQEGEPQGQEEQFLGPMECSSQEGTQSSEHQGLRRAQEGHPILQEGEGVLQLSTASNLTTRSTRQTSEGWHQLWVWACLHLSSAGASFLLSTRH